MSTEETPPAEGPLPPFRVSPRAAWVDSRATAQLCYVARPPEVGPQTLTGPGRALWLSWADGEPFDAGVRRLAREYGAPVQTVAADAEALARQLLDLGLLEPLGEPEMPGRD